ncbi:butyrophilin-like protein 3 [Monodelphis domestica]|nr:butyrophilin-like protein 3 [Monodelphis domestica]
MLNVLALLCPIQVFHNFEHHFLLISILSLIELASGQFQVIGPNNPIQALIGEDVLFSCHISPKMNVKNMEVRFFRNQFSSVLLLYKDGKEIDERQMQEYQGRTQFMQDAITEGTVSLKLKNIVSSDMAKYGCWFSSKTFYEEYTWELQVVALGSTPLISLEGNRDGGILLVCQSSGWLPQPKIQWRYDPDQYLLLNYTVNQDDHGLFSIKTTLTIKEHSNKNISCLVLNLALGQMKESRLQIADHFYQITFWRNAFIIMMLPFLAALIFLFCTNKKQGKIKKKLELMEKLKEAEWITATEHAVEVTLDPDTAHHKLHVSEDQKSVTHEDGVIYEDNGLENNIRFQFPCVMASQSFSSGKHYWEVEVGKMKKWYLGVCWNDVTREKEKVMFSPDKGYWILGLWNKSEYFTYTPYRKALRFSVEPHRVGVFINYEAKEISFFNVNDRSHIYTFTNCDFKGKALYPCFCPHKSDSPEHPIPMSISTVLLSMSSENDNSEGTILSSSNDDDSGLQMTACLLPSISCHPKRL